jgi:hypothetical protein
LKSSLVLLATLLFLVSCAQTKPKVSRKKVYSQETQSTFEDIEKEKAIENYRLMRLRDWKKYKKKKPKTIYRKKVFTKPKRKRRRPLVNPVEQKNEIEQNLIYYCMEHRKDSKFDDESDCKLFTDNILDKCKESNDFGEPELLTCIKGRLR